MEYIGFIIGRELRNIRQLLKFPLWYMSSNTNEDNHLYKKIRIKKLGLKYYCTTLIETGTFYGQMTNAMKYSYKKVLTVELYKKLYLLNKKAFEKFSNIQIYHGDSSTMIKQMIDDSEGRILFWLDGHFSGAGTACGDEVSPILIELESIKNCGRVNDCILIDDVRLFDGTDGYPTLEATKEKLFQINQNYSIYLDRDCLVAVVN